MKNWTRCSGKSWKAVDEAFGKYLAITGITGSFREDNALKKKISNAKAIVNSFGKSVDVVFNVFDAGDTKMKFLIIFRAMYCVFRAIGIYYKY